MKKKDNLQNMGEILKSLLKTPKLRKRYYETSIQFFLEKKFKGYYSQYVKNVYLQNRTLKIQIESSSFKSELMYQKEVLKIRLNQELGEEYIANIDIY